MVFLIRLFRSTRKLVVVCFSRGKPLRKRCSRGPTGWAARYGSELRRLVPNGYRKLKVFELRIEKKVEWIDRRDFRHQIDFNHQLVGLLLENQPCQVVVVDVVLPVDEVLSRLDRQRVAQYLRPAMRRGSEPHDLWAERYRSFVLVFRAVIQCDLYAHSSSCDQLPARLAV